MSNQVVGYVRVSTLEQNPERQLNEVNLNKKFIEYYSGRTLNRPELNKCIEYVREGDILYIHSIDRLARDLRDLQTIIKTLVNKGVEIRFLKENLSFTNKDDPLANFTLHMMGAFAEFERNMIRMRQREGIEAAKKLGKHMGRPRKINDDFKKEVKEKLEQGLSIRRIAIEMKVSRATIYKIIDIPKREYKINE